MLCGVGPKPTRRQPEPKRCKPHRGNAERERPGTLSKEPSDRRPAHRCRSLLQKSEK